MGDRETQAKKEWLSKSESNASVNKKMNEIKNVLRNTLSETMKNLELSKLQNADNEVLDHIFDKPICKEDLTLTALKRTMTKSLL